MSELPLPSSDPENRATQVAALMEVAVLLPHKVAWLIESRVGDVLCLRNPFLKGMEVVGVSGFDLWENGHLTRPDLTAEEAAEILSVEDPRLGEWGPVIFDSSPLPD